MKAVYIEQFGGPEVVKYGDLPDPSAAAGQIVVDAHAASVNGADWKVQDRKSTRLNSSHVEISYAVFCLNKEELPGFRWGVGSRGPRRRGGRLPRGGGPRRRSGAGGAAHGAPRSPVSRLLFFFNDTATTEIYTLSLHDALPIFAVLQQGEGGLLLAAPALVLLQA